MLEPDESEVSSWSRDVAKIAGIDVLIVKEERRKTLIRFLTEEVAVFFVLLSLTLAASATYFFMYSPVADLKPTTTSSTSTSTTTSTTTSSTTTSTTTTTTSTTTSTTTTSTTTSTFSTTTTTIECGGIGEWPCETANGPLCFAGTYEGKDGKCAKEDKLASVPSGLGDGTCGSFALDM